MAQTPADEVSQDIQVRLTKWDDDDGAKLRARQRLEIDERGYGAEPGTAPSAADVPLFIVILRNQTPVACGGLRPLAKCSAAAEVKRMYTVPKARGRPCGVSDLLMQSLEQAALTQAWSVLRLETGISMIHARKFYERHGFVEIPKFGQYIESGHSVCYEKILRPAMQTETEVRHVSWENAEGAELRARLVEELIAEGVEDELGPPLTAEDIPVFIVIWRNSVPIACGGLRLMADGDGCTTEIKRMYIVPEARGRGHGVSEVLMKALEDEARRHSWLIVRLATGVKMLNARKFYERHGYAEVPVFGHYVDTGGSVYYEKILNHN